MALYGGVELVGQPNLENVAKLDLLPMPAISEMMRVGMAIDIPYLNLLTEELDAEMVELRYEIASYIPLEKLDEFIEKANTDDDLLNVDSGDQLAALMFDTLGIGTGKQLKMTKSGKRISTGKKQLELLKHEHPVVPKVLMYKERAKLKSTYTVPLPLLAKFHGDGLCWCGIHHPAESQRIHTTILSTRTSTSRYASKNPNLQNISVRSDLGRRVRKAFVATGGTSIVGCDFSQAEMRLGAHYSLDENLVRIFEQGLDPHTDTAKRAFHTDNPDKLTQRDPCKNVNFGVFYGLSGAGLYDLMAVTYATAKMDMPADMTVEWCNQFIEDWFNLYPGVKGYIEKQHYRAYRYGVVWDLFGRIRRVPEVRSVHKRVVAAGLRQAGNMPIQACCAEWMKLAIAEVQEEVVKAFRADGIYCWPLMTIHDELLLEVENGYEEQARELMEGIMADVMRDRDSGEWMFRVPVKADAKVMERWSK